MNNALGLAVLVGGMALWPAMVEGDPAIQEDGRIAWSYAFSGGYDTFVHVFPLAEDDTTETISELTFVLSAEGRSARRARHQWRLRPEFWLGTELFRESLDFSYQLRPDSNLTAFRLDANYQGRQYRGGSEYALTSDSSEGRLKARWYVSPAGRMAAELRLLAGLVRYGTPSTLELNHRDLGAAATLRSGRGTSQRTAVGARLLRRTYPDSAAIDRTVVSVDAEYDRSGLQGAGLRLFHRTERRLIAEEDVRPSAWTHWTEAFWRQASGPGQLMAEAQSEVWRYGRETVIYSDSWRLAGQLAYRWGAPLGPGWKIGLAGENLAAGEAAETYRQLGILVGADTFGADFSGSVSVELGQRDYRRESSESTLSTSDLSALDVLDDLSLYGDFQYWEIFLMASWSLAAEVSLDFLAHYQPESHTEKSDNSAVGFASVRVIWMH